MPWDYQGQDQLADAMASFLTAPMFEDEHPSTVIEQVPWYLQLARALRHTAGNSLTVMIGEAIEQELYDVCRE